MSPAWIQRQSKELVFMVIDKNIRLEIVRRLKLAEQEHEIDIVYACESGSRAWGFESPDSDYDVRFIYARKQDWYLSFDVETRRDVVEYPIVDEIDCSGWDIKKAMYLFTRTNGALLEWLNSPIKYIEKGDFADTMRNISPRAINKTALCYHYSHMARGNAKEYLFSDEVKLKKYFYVLRPLLAIRFLEQSDGPPPVEFESLLHSVCPKDLVPVIENLIQQKKKTPEIGYGPKIPEINEFIESEFERHGSVFSGQGRPDILESKAIKVELNELFRKVVGSV
jgi:predicted nucleotidyltransferase